jgi:putative glutamine amidotransferase
MTKPIIGISLNETEDSGAKLHNLPINYLPAGYVRGVQQAGGLPILLPVSSKDDAKSYVTQIDKLVLTGGQNVNPKFYNEERLFDESLMLTPRDEFELALIHEAIRQEKPIFAVCRGLQLLNVALGGTLHQDLSKRDIEPVKHMQDPTPREIPTHSVTIKEDSLISQVYGNETNVNSFHFQAIKDVAKELVVTAISEDGIVEAVESLDEKNRWVGLQWHPDFYFEEFEKERQMFDFVVNEL